jgi:hypothetical protein
MIRAFRGVVVLVEVFTVLEGVDELYLIFE